VTNPLDKWVISRVHQLNEHITRNMDAYNLPDAMAEILPFIEDASNWYVRRSRRRFWKSEDDGDKNDAYRTLHYVLMRLSLILAPFTPFLAEELYQNLGGASESVHLLDWPTEYAVDQLVLDEMQQVRAYVNEGLSLRAKAGIKVRQPLATARITDFGKFVDFEAILKEELNVKEVIADGVVLRLQAGEWVVTQRRIELEGAVIRDRIEFDEKLTPELEREGLMREVIRYVQAARKKSGLNVDDRIMLSLTTDDGELAKAIKEHQDVIFAETLAENTTDEGDYSEEVKVEGANLTVSLSKKQ
jgi:isoleucyl-tRNA synthetase